MATDPKVFQFIGETVTNASNAFVTPAASNLMGALQATVLTGVTLYIVMTGYAISTGAIEAPFWTFLKQCVKIMIIAFFALTVDGYINGIVEAINGLENGVAQAMNTSGGATVNIYQTMDDALGKGFDLVQVAFQRASEAGWDLGSAISWVIVGLVIAIGTLLVCMLGGAMVIVAKFALSVMFALGPLFVVSLMFPATARFFDSWFSQVMNYVLTIVIMAIIMTFAVKAFTSFTQVDKLSGGGDYHPMFVALQIGTLSGILCWIIFQAAGMASGLAGGVSLAALGLRHLAMPVTGGLSAVKGVNNMLNPVVQKRDMKSGQLIAARRSSHLIQGNTKFNPAYREYIKKNGGTNWGKASGGTAKGS